MDSKKIVWYYNGVEVKSGQVELTPRSSKRNLMVGRGYLDNFQGFLDEVTIFNRALSAKEIKTIYKIGALD
jgi:hypothetical protein